MKLWQWQWTEGWSSVSTVQGVIPKLQYRILYWQPPGGTEWQWTEGRSSANIRSNA